MEETKKNLATLAAARADNAFKKNLLKEYLQIVALDFIYSAPKYAQLVFYGGSCLKHCHDLPRLSEDLDFVDIGRQIDIGGLAADLEFYFKKNTDLEVKTATQKFRISLKFPILRQLGLSAAGDSNFLFLKIEIFKDFDFCRDFKMEIVPVFKSGRSILIRTFDLPTMMATKIRAIFLRKWEKTAKGGEVIAKVKGRDYFDLMWYLQKNIKPNINCVENVEGIFDLKKKLIEAVEKTDEKSIRADLEPLIGDREFLKDLSKNIKTILIGQIGSMK